MFDELIDELEHEYDRISLFNDTPSKATLEVSLRRWISQLQFLETIWSSEYKHKEDHDLKDEINELRKDIAHLEAKIRNATLALE